jgi:HEAT repeat protein
MRVRDARKNELRNTDTINPLIETVEAGTPRAYAATVLGYIGDTRSLPLLINALSDKEAEVRVAATSGLRFLGDLRAVSPLVSALDDPNEEVTTAVAETLGWLGSEDAIVPLMRFYESKRWQKKVAAVHALGKIGHPQSLPLVRLALVHPIRKVRDAAKFALSSYGWKRRAALQKHGT